MNPHPISHGAPFDDQPYDVHVGHARIQVRAQGILDAIRQARLHLCREMPWLWDMIYALEDHKFSVRLSATPHV